MHALAKQQGMSEVNGNFVYETERGQELMYDDEEENDEMINKIEDNENNVRVDHGDEAVPVQDADQHEDVKDEDKGVDIEEVYENAPAQIYGDLSKGPVTDEVGVGEMVEQNSDISMEDEDDSEPVNEVMDQDSGDEGADTMNEVVLSLPTRP